MKAGDLCSLLVNAAQRHVPDAVDSLVRNTHMHSYRGEPPTQELVDAIVVGFVNSVAGQMGVDLALYARDLHDGVRRDFLRSGAGD